ncbi:hypothetical protein [Nocardioides marmoraquaticus]
MRLDRPVLVSSLVAGSLWSLVPVIWLGAWVLAVIGLGYVVVVSLFFAAACSRPLTIRQEAAVWLVPWVVAVAVWFAVLSPIDGPGVFAFLLALLLATPAYVVWQLTAVLLRELVRWRGSASDRAVGGA